MNDYPAQQQFALKSPPFRRFLYGSFFVRCSDWMDLTILNWIVYEWTHSPLSLGILNACRLIPVFLFSLYAGGVADKYNRRQSLLVIYSGMLVSTLFIAFIIGEQASFILLLSAITVRSVLMSFEVPIRNAWLADLVPGSMLGSAITLQTTSINVARMVGPAFAGVLLGYFAASNIMLWVSAGTLLVIFTLLTVPGDQENTEQGKKRESKSIKDTIQYIIGQPGILAVLLVAIAPMIFGFPYTTMLPIFSKELMNLGSAGFGFLLSISSLGAITATGLLAFRQPVMGGRWLIVSTLAFGTSLVLFTTFSGFYLASAGLMFLIGFTSQYYRTLSRIMIQIKVDGEYRGRVLSIALMDRGYIPLGSLFIGWIASSFDAYVAGLSMGLGTILFTILIVRSNRYLWKE
ncbi:MFS transporter [Rossellomorea sp. YZS02]|uniref:MFS transporter n=1 Tax=Rossellomorea sp. YZS02 TaxID=3097358 RepID=UPI002A1865B9|nr:MFS transporter [Rossellomorea sp. YZS02]MDX8345630.1 MFS transporter [Rossellomorea sp. YZS02]